MKHIALAAALLAAPIPASASMLGPFSDLLVFGDSLSDPGNLLNALVGPPTSPLPLFYPEGQLTDGNTWASQLGADFASGTNFAFASARATTNGQITFSDLPGAPELDVPDLADQIASFQTAVSTGALTLGHKPLATVWIGGNDIRDALAAADPEASITAAIREIVAGVGALTAARIDNIVVFGAPDLGQIPEVVNDPSAAILIPLATEASVQFNTNLQTAMAIFLPMQVSYFDTFGLFQELAAAPGTFGFPKPLGDTCIDALLAGLTTDCTGYLFYDDIHPTEAAHAIVAARFTDSLEPVPLPAGGLLLLTGLGGLILARRHRRTARHEPRA